jgi:RNA polymerase sigma-70 factor, ECF subfamily
MANSIRIAMAEMLLKRRLRWQTLFQQVWRLHVWYVLGRQCPRFALFGVEIGCGSDTRYVESYRETGMAQADQVEERHMGRTLPSELHAGLGGPPPIPDELDERSLIAAAQLDTKAFAPLYQRYRGPVYRYLRANIGSDEEAADMTQQVFLRALDALPNYRERGIPFAAWLFRIAHHAAADYQRHGRSAMAWETLPETLEASPDQQPEAVVLRNESLARLRALLAQLDPAKQNVLALRFAARLSVAEIAAAVGKSPAAVKKQLFRILQTLKEQYHEA